MASQQGKMSIRQSRPFTVEIKGKRRKPVWAAAGLEIHPIVDGAPPAPATASNGNGGRAAARVAAADILFRSPSVSMPVSAPSPVNIGPSGPSAEQAETAIHPRVLPDLTSQEDPIEVRLREEAEERAARRHRPRGPRKKAEVQMHRSIAESEPEPTDTKKVIRRTRPLTQGPKKGAALKPKTPKPIIVRQTASTPRSNPSDVPAQTGRSHGSRWAARAEVRKAKRKGLAVAFRPGERWKRRLPKSAW